MKYPPAASMKYAADAAYDLSALHADKQQFSAVALGHNRTHKYPGGGDESCAGE